MNPETQTPPSPPITPPEPNLIPTAEVPKPQNNSVVIILSLILIVMAGITAFLWYQNQQLKSMLANFQTPITSPTPVATIDPTANWKTYINNYWGISFKYPDTLFKPCSNYVVNEKDGIQFWEKDFICPDAHDIPYKIGFFGYDPDIYTKEKQPSSTETIIVDGKQAQKKTYIYTADDGQSFGWKQSVRIVFTLSNGTIVLQQIGDNLDEQKAFNQILSTFKFTDTTVTGPTTPPTVTYVCPKNGWVDCTSAPNMGIKRECTSEAISWFRSNCPNFQGVTQ